MAELTDTRPRTVEQWLRNGVPLKHWDVLVKVARERGIRWLTHEVLYDAHAVSQNGYDA